ncbi:hypothetical protein CSIRO_0055 [Bradyrhizobiaceae bacterium SG-6C]|nr:hypothetical protein CSIRO_0055 [Bradyrhizobiaceae bacterium SG-6C]
MTLHPLNGANGTAGKSLARSAIIDDTQQKAIARFRQGSNGHDTFAAWPKPYFL